MKKMKKEKKKKEQSRRSWPVWLTVLLVILGIGSISGVTVLGVYLAGGFRENIINPADIYFSYDESLFNANTSQLEVVDDFTLTVSSSTSHVTNDEVTLSFEGSTSVSTSNGYISNGVIRVPQRVRIGEEFTVTLSTSEIRDDDGEILEDAWISGGIANLVATSEYDQLSPTAPLRIAVDVPVWGIEIETTNSRGEQTNQIVTGESFSVNTKFIPASSQYLYSDNVNSVISTENVRVKHTYYVADAGEYAGAITTRYDSPYSVTFLAGEQTVDSITLRGYTFIHANDQIETEGSVETTTDEAFYNQILDRIGNWGDQMVPGDSDPQNFATGDSQNISIGMASVGRYTVGKASQTISTSTNQSMTLYMNRYMYDEQAEFLGVNVYSTSGNNIEGMLGNIAINFSYNSQDPSIDSFLQVSGGDYVEIDGLRYYMPNTNVTNLNYSYWTLRSSREADITMTVVLLIENEDGGYSLFGEPPYYTVTLSVSEHQEQPLQWTDSSDINVMLDYNSDGNVSAETINLESLIQIPSDNIYKDPVFFVYFGDGEKDEVSQTVNSVIGESGYNYDLAGIYATYSENLLLFPIVGSSITLRNTGSFRLYYGTLVTENGVPVIETDGSGNRTYSIAVMSQEYILVTCEKSLYQDSVSAGEVNTDQFVPLENGEIAIDQGNTSSLAISFRIDSEAVSVFTDEYNSGYMSLVFRDEQNSDISSNFTVESSQILLDDITGDSIITYNVLVNTGVNINQTNGIYLSSVSLRYDNTEDEPIEWDMPIMDKIISIYSPIARDIRVDTTGNQTFAEYINGQTMTVNQTLGTDGNFVTSIVAGQTFNSVTNLLTALLGVDNSYVIVTDQKGRTDTLSESWQFELVAGSDINAINLNGKTFTFRQSDNAQVSLELVTIDGNASSLTNGQQLRFTVTSVGITDAESVTSWDPYPTVGYTDDQFEQSDVSNLSVTLYGAKNSDDGIDGRITLANLVKFYVGDDDYTRIRFQLSQQYLNDTTLTDEMIFDLFNSDNGMIILYDGNGDVVDLNTEDYNNAQSIKQRLSGQEITAIEFRNNFAIDHIIRFSITDTGNNGAINSTLSLTLRSAYTLSGENYPTDVNNPLYAHVETDMINKVTNNYFAYLGNDTYPTEIESLYQTDGNTSDIYYIVSSGSGYILVNGDEFDDTETAEAQSVGEFDRTNGNIKFYDFWNVESRNFAVTFTPEGDNYFTLDRVIQFNVTRDLAVESLNNTYYIISGKEYYVTDDFISVYRKSEENSAEGDRTDLPESLTRVYEFGDYFDVIFTNNHYQIEKKDNSPFLFKYNQKALSTTLRVYYVDENNDGERILLGQVNIPIELYSGSMQPDVTVEDYNVYGEIANMLSYNNKDSIKAQLQSVGDGEYIMVQQGTWFLSSTFVSGSEYSIYANMIDSEGNWLDSYYDAYENTSKGGTDLTFKNNQSRILQGLGENVYLVLYFGSPNDNSAPSFPGTTAVMYVPLIISSIGFDYVNYDLSQFSSYSESDKLEIAITDPNSYIVNGTYSGPYVEITAGQQQTIMTQYNFTDEVTTSGLYLLNGYSFTASFAYHPLTTSSYLSTSENIIKDQWIDSVDGKQIGQMILNHLSSSYQDFYFAVKYTITSTSESRDFFIVYKVKPDVIVEDSVYAYNKNSQTAAEYLQGQQNVEGTVDFDEIFGSSTLAENQKRFSITKQIDIISVDSQVNTLLNLDIESREMRLWIGLVKGGEEVEKLLVTAERPEEGLFSLDLASRFDEEIEEGDTINISILSGDGKIYYSDLLMLSSLNETNTVESVTVGDIQYTREEDWQEYIDIYFSSDMSEMYYTPLTSEQITVIVRHSYDGGVDRDQLSVIGGEQYYQFVINSTTFNYSVRFTATTQDGEEQFTTSSSNQTFTWDNLIYSNENDEITATMDIHLLQGVDAGSQGYEEVWNRLHIALTDETTTSGDEISESALDMTKDDGNGHVGFTYDSSQDGDGKLTLYFSDYITSARTLSFTIYTEQGYLATLNVEVEATASYQIKEGSSTDILGGTTPNFSSIFDIKLNNGSDVITIAPENYDVSATVLSSTEYQNFSGEDFVKFESDNNGGKFIVANLLRDYQVTFLFTVTFKASDNNTMEGYVDKQFAFSSTVTLKRNIQYNTSVNGGNVIAGQSKPIAGIFRENGIVDGEEDITQTIYYGSSTSQAYNSIYNGNEILTNFVASQTNADINLTVRVYFNYDNVTIDDANRDEVPYQEFNMTYSLSIYPSVEINVNYPTPSEDGEELSPEYINSGSTYENLLDNFLLHSPIFGNDWRVVIAPAMQNGETITYDYDNPLMTATKGGEIYEEDEEPNLLETSDLRIAVYSQQNATVYATTSDGETSEEENYASSETIPNNATDLRLIRGTLTTSTDNSQEIVDDMGTSTIRFSITYQGVIVYYDVQLLTNTLSLQVNNVTKNTASGSGPVASVTYSPSLSLQGDYRLVYTDERNFYASSPISISSENAGTSANIELGYNMASNGVNFRYVGTYQGSSFTFADGQTNGLITNATEETNLGTNVDANNTVFENINLAYVNYETSYIDQTNLTNSLFAKSRLAQLSINSSLSRTGSYYLVFTDGENYYASYSQYFNSSDAGRTINVDLGYSMAEQNTVDGVTTYGENYTYVGAFLVTNFETNDITISSGSESAQAGTIIKSNGDKVTADEISLLGVNHDANNAMFDSVELISRVQLIYGGLEDNISVDYSFYGQYLSELKLNELQANDIDTIKSVKLFNSDLPIDDGSNQTSISVNATYYYYPTIDINVDSAISGLYSLQILETNNEYESMVSEFGVRHPSTGQLVNVGDFGGDRASLELQVIDYNSEDASIDASTHSILAGYLRTFNETEFKYQTTVNREYLRPSAITSAGRYAYDYRLLPLGADNQGDLVLLKISYRVQLQADGTSVSKDFYVVVKIIPDYIISFGGNVTDFTEETVEGDVISNVNNKYDIISNNNSDSEYSAFTLTKDSNASDDDGYVSVKHANGDTAVRNAELATDNFTITMTVPGGVVDGVTYNDEENVNQKLSGDLSSAKWSYNEDTGVYTLNQDSTTLFESAKKVIFGTQYYMIEAVDNYGFKYAVYFSLVSQYDEPYIAGSNITLTEGSMFDIGAQYKQLSVTTIQDNDSTSYYINDQYTDPDVTDGNITLIEIFGIQAHYFDTDPSGIGGLNKNGNYGYEISDDDSSQWPNYSEYEENGYFNVPLIDFVTVDSINFYDSEDNQVVQRPIDLSGESYSLATTREGVFNGLSKTPRDVYTSNNAILTVPRLTSTDLFEDSNQAQVTMVIRLKYASADNTAIEYYDLATTVTIIREVNISMNEKSSPVRDGEAFTVSREFNVASGSGDLNASGVKYINDTLEVLVNAYSTTTFQLAMDGRTVSRSITNGRSVARTEYISISQLFGQNVNKGDEITIIPQDNNAQFYYVTNDQYGNIINNHFVPATDEDGVLLVSSTTGTYFVYRVENGMQSSVNNYIDVSKITNDVVYVEDRSLIDNARKYYNVRKYYILDVTFTGDTGGEITYTYRTSKNYVVTGYYFGLSRAIEGDMVMNLLGATNNDGVITSQFSQWNRSFTMTTANADLEGVLDNSKNNYLNYLEFIIDTASDPNASGNASIDDNGTITYNDNFTYNEYIRVVVRMRVSGADRTFKTEDDTFIEMDTLRLGWDKNYRTVTTN